MSLTDLATAAPTTVVGPKAYTVGLAHRAAGTLHNFCWIGAIMHFGGSNFLEAVPGQVAGV